MKIAIVFPGIHRKGGVERVAYECAKFLARRGHDLHIFAEAWETIPGVTYHSVGASPHVNFFSPLAFYRNSTRAVDFSAFDVVNTHGVACPRGGLMWTHSIHRAWLEIAKQFRPPLSLARMKQRLNPLHPVLLHLENLHLRDKAYSHLIALTPQSGSDIMRLYHVPPSDITHISPGYSAADFNTLNYDADRQRLRSLHGYGPQDKVMIFVANELDRKGFGPLIQAMAKNDDPHLRLHVIGRVQPGAYSREIERLKLGPRIRFAGVVSPADLTGSYAAADMFVLPTQYEGWGLVIVEALASGIPVLTSRLAPASVAVQEGVTGYLLEDPKDADEIAAKIDRMRKLPPIAPKEISASVIVHEWDNVLQRYETLLQKYANHVATKRLAG